MAEVCESPAKPVDAAALREWTLDALRQDRLIGDRTEVVSFGGTARSTATPLPSAAATRCWAHPAGARSERRLLARSLRRLKYEVSNQDHSFMQGVEVVNRLAGEGDEPTIDRPDYANSGVFLKAASG